MQLRVTYRHRTGTARGCMVHPPYRNPDMADETETKRDNSDKKVRNTLGTTRDYRLLTKDRTARRRTLTEEFKPNNLPLIREGAAYNWDSMFHPPRRVGGG